MFENFGNDQVWEQILHHTEYINSKTIKKLTNLTTDEEFRKVIDEVDENNDQENVLESEQGDEMSSGVEMMEDPEYDMMEPAEEGEEEMNDYGPEDNQDQDFEYGQEEDPNSAKSGDELDEYMEDLEEMDDVKGKLKIPKDVVGDEEDDEDDEGLLGEDSEDNGDGFGEDEKESEEDFENDVFAMARENKEMGDTTASEGPNFANTELFKTMNKIEDEMMEDKQWQLKGEVAQKDRNYNSLLDEYVDFDTATKAAPQITQETTNEIEAMIK